jgi:predicted nuclease with TOPRIM domain
MERESEYIKDRLNQQIRNLTRENSILKDALYRKDREYIDLQMRHNDANESVNLLSVILGVTLLLLIGVTIAAIRHWGGAP